MRGVVAVPTRPEPGLMASYARHLALAGGNKQIAAELAAQGKANDRVVGSLKSAIGGHWSGDADAAGLQDASYIATSFQPFLRGTSLFYRALDAGMTRVPLEERIGWTTASATGFVVGEGAAVPVSRVAIEAGGILRQKANALIVMTPAMLRSAGIRGEALIARELRRGVSHAVDSEFLALVIDSGTTALTSTGNMAVDAAADLAALLSAVEPTAESRLLLAMSPEVAILASTLTTSSGAFAFPNMGPTGGQMLGIEAMAVDAVTEGTIVLFDLSGIAGESELITVDGSDDTTIEMETDPQSSTRTATATEQVSMFQTNSVALMAAVWFGAHRFRDEAVATMSGVEWGLPTTSEGE